MSRGYIWIYGYSSFLLSLYLRVYALTYWRSQIMFYLLVVQGKTRVGGGGGGGGGYQERSNSLPSERKSAQSAKGTIQTCRGLPQDIQIFFCFYLLILFLAYWLVFSWIIYFDMLVDISKSIFLLLSCMLLETVSKFKYWLFSSLELGLVFKYATLARLI